jgi:hypothetical protein
LLNELLDYGTQLLPKALENSPKDIKAVCVIAVQLRQVLTHLDGMTVLIAAGNSFTAALQLRSLLEIQLAMEWLLKSDTEAKANHLYVANLRRRRQWQSVAIPGTPEAARRAEFVKRLSLPPQVVGKIKSEVDAIDKILASQEFSPIDAKFQRNYAKSNYDKPWYEIYGTSSIRKMAEELGKVNDYMYFYSSFSEITHGGNIWKNIPLGGESYVNPIREPAKIVKIANNAASFAMSVYRMVIQQYMPNDMPAFDKKYKTEWRTRYLKTIVRTA